VIQPSVEWLLRTQAANGPMGTAIISATDLFRRRDFDPRRDIRAPRTAEYAGVVPATVFIGAFRPSQTVIEPEIKPVGLILLRGRRGRGARRDPDEHFGRGTVEEILKIRRSGMPSGVYWRNPGGQNAEPGIEPLVQGWLAGAPCCFRNFRKRGFTVCQSKRVTTTDLFRS